MIEGVYMQNINVILITKPDFDVPGVIGGLASLTQHKKVFTPTSHDAGLKIMRRLVDMSHTSLLECADFGFIFESTSRVFLAQITRHRVASYTSGSQQYQDHDNFPYITPESIEENPIAKEKYINLMEVINNGYIDLKELVGKDDARYVLPGAAANHLYAKFNLREIVCAVMPQRICRRNTPESQGNIQKMCQALIAGGFEDCIRFGGCACITEGKCDQGKMCCGKPYESWEEMVGIPTPQLVAPTPKTFGSAI
jgi:thymidylate synthase (FAD)